MKIRLSAVKLVPNPRTFDRGSKKKDFSRRFIIVDETWVHHYPPESKEQYKQWTTIPSAGKVIATFFWGPYGVKLVLLDLLKQFPGLSRVDVLEGVSDRMVDGSGFRVIAVFAHILDIGCVSRMDCRTVKKISNF